VVDQEEFAAMKYEKSTRVDPKIAAKKDLERLKLKYSRRLQFVYYVSCALEDAEAC
jgi:hypothetical protein